MWIDLKNLKTLAELLGKFEPKSMELIEISTNHSMMKVRDYYLDRIQLPKTQDLKDPSFSLKEGTSQPLPPRQRWRLYRVRFNTFMMLFFDFDECSLLD